MLWFISTIMQEKLDVFELTMAHTMLLWKMYWISKWTSPMPSAYNVLPLVQNYNIAVIICYWIQANSLFVSGVNRFNMLPSPCFKFYFLLFYPSIFTVVNYMIHYQNQKYQCKITIPNCGRHLYLLDKTVKCRFHKKTVLICQKG